MIDIPRPQTAYAESGSLAVDNGDIRLPDKPLSGIRLVLMDMDGTALNEKKEMSPNLLMALRLLRSKRIPYTFASARLPAMMGSYCSQAQITGPVIALEGAAILKWNNKRILSRTSIPQAEAEMLLAFCHELGLDYTICTTSSAYFRQDTNRLPRYQNYNLRALSMGLSPVPCLFYEAYGAETLAKEGVLKLFIDNPKGEKRKRLMDFLSKFPNLRTDCSEGKSVTVMAGSVSKAGAILFLCEYLGIAPQEMCCFGDYYNDVGMLQLVGHSVAMGNAPVAVRRSARYVTLPNTRDGVAWFIRRYLVDGT